MDYTKLRELDYRTFGKHYTKRRLRSNLILPSQYASYAVCTEFAKKWFLDKFPEHFFNSIYVEGSHTFDEFRKFSDIDSALKKTNPILAIIPTIDMNHNREWIDSSPEFPSLLRRTRMEGVIFSDITDNKGLYLQLQFKTIKMNFLFKIRLDTRAEELDMVEYLKHKHKAGFTETIDDLLLDIHVPKYIISQIAFDNGIKLYDTGYPVDSFKMLQYLNSHALVPFIYKLRCSTGNDEYFIKVPNCVAHLRMEMPSYDDGERQNMLTTNYNIDFQIEVEMTAPYCYSYSSQQEQCFLCANPNPLEVNKDICIMTAVRTDIPSEDGNHWKMITTNPIEYRVDDEDVGTCIDIDFKDQFKDTDLGRVIKYTLDTGVLPNIFVNFIVMNDGVEMPYKMDWETLTMHLTEPIHNINLLIGVYCDNGYLMNTLLQFMPENDISRVKPVPNKK